MVFRDVGLAQHRLGEALRRVKSIREPQVLAQVLRDVLATKPSYMIELAETARPLLAADVFEAFIVASAHKRNDARMMPGWFEHPMEVAKGVTDVAWRVLEHMTVDYKVKRFGWPVLKGAEIDADAVSCKRVPARVDVRGEVVAFTHLPGQALAEAPFRGQMQHLCPLGEPQVPQVKPKQARALKGAAPSAQHMPSRVHVGEKAAAANVASNHMPPSWRDRHQTAAGVYHPVYASANCRGNRGASIRNRRVSGDVSLRHGSLATTWSLATT